MEMEEKRILGACIVISLLGILLLVLFAKNSPAQQVSVGELGPEDAGKFVRVSGVLGQISSVNGNYFLKICETGCVTVFVPNRLAQAMEGCGTNLSLLRQRQWTTVEGVLKEYDGGLEVVPLACDSIQG